MVTVRCAESVHDHKIRRIKMNPNDPAFPVAFDTEEKGLTKREYFAKEAMAALIIHREVQLDHESKVPADVIARMAIAQADALIAELSKKAK